MNRKLLLYRLAPVLAFLLPIFSQTTGYTAIFPEPDVPQDYPVLLREIDKSQADYKTPKNTASASNSALLRRDIDWYLQTMTVETAAQEQEIFNNAGIPLTKIFDTVDPADEVYITGKIPYKDGLILTLEVRSHDTDGTIFKGYSGYIREDGLWKRTNRFSDDENLERYLDVTYTNCIAGYRFGPDFLEDSCWHNNDLTNNSNTTIAVDRRYDEDLTAAVFNGAGNGLAREQLNDIPVNQLSMGGWLKSDKIAHSAVIIAIGGDKDSTAIILDPGKGLRYRIHAGGGQVEGTAAANDLHDSQWHHVYLTYDGAKANLYVDGELQDSQPAAGPINSAPFLHIGYRKAADKDSAGNYFKGRLDDIQIYNKALTADEISRKYKNGTMQSL